MNPAQPDLTHFDSEGRAVMVDVGAKAETLRRAIACGRITMLPATLARIRAGSIGKGDVIGIARIAAIQAAKRTWELIPLCHPIALASLEVAIEPSNDGRGLRLEATARTSAATGVEMEALTAATVGLLTLYDMVKSADPAMTIGPVQLLSKQGGRNGDWRRPASSPESIAIPALPSAAPEAKPNHG